MIKIYVTSDRDGQRYELPDLYFFEENGIRDFSGIGHHENYRIEMFVNGEKVFDNDDMLFVKDERIESNFDYITRCTY